ncbi:renin receptor-like isoform X2 [Glandiceps talaboti]
MGGLEVFAANQVHFTHKPDYVQLSQTAGEVRASEIADVISLALGFSTNKELTWSGLSSGSLFNRPKANILVTVEGLEDGMTLDLKSDVTTYPLNKDVPFVNTESVTQHLENAFSNQSPLLVDLSASGKLFSLHSKHPHLFSQLPTTLTEMQPVLLNSQLSVLFSFDMGSLNFSKEADFTFLSEMQLIQEIVDVVSKNTHLVQDGVPDIYTFSMAGVHYLQQQYGKNSPQVKDGLRVLASFLNKFTQTMISLYDGDVMAEIVTMTPSSPTLRRVRREEGGEGAGAESDSSYGDINVADSYSDNFATIFHISLWISVAWILAVFVICYLMWYMDPGDTIIYRMTSTRIKTE